MQWCLSHEKEKPRTYIQKVTSVNNSAEKGSSENLKNLGKSTYFSMLKADVTLTAPDYPGSRDPSLLDRVYSPIRKKRDVSNKIGSAEQLKTFSSEKTLPRPSTQNIPSTQNPNSNSFAHLNLDVKEIPKAQNVRDKYSNTNRDVKTVRLADTQSKQNYNIYYDEYTKPYSRKTNTNAKSFDSKLEQHSSHGVGEIIRQIPSQNIEKISADQEPFKQDPSSFIQQKSADFIEIQTDSNSPPTKDSAAQEEKTSQQDQEIDSVSSKSDALLCDPCANDLLSTKKRAHLCELAQSEKELLTHINEYQLKKQEDQNLKKIADELRNKDTSFGNKQTGEELRVKLRELKEKDQREFRKQLEEIERVNSDSLEKIAEKKKKYREDLLNQVQDRQKQKNEKFQSELKEEKIDFLPRGEMKKYLSTGDLQKLLQDQIHEKQERAAQETYERTVQAKKELDQMLALEDEKFRRLNEKDQLKREVYVKALQESVDTMRKNRAQSCQSKLREREEVDMNLAQKIELQNELNNKKKNDMSAYREYLVRQIDEKKNSPSKLKPEEDSFINNFGSRSMMSESKMKYKEDLQKQICEDNERREKQRTYSTEPAEGFSLHNRQQNNLILAPRELNDQILSQIAQNQKDKEKIRENKVKEEYEILRQLEQEREKSQQGKNEHERRRKEEFNKSNLEMVEKKLNERKEEKRLKELEHESMKEIVSTGREHEVLKFSTLRLNQSQYREALQNQMNQDIKHKSAEKTQDITHRDQFILESTQIHEQLQKKRRDNQQNQIQSLAEKTNYELNEQKTKLQTKHEREPSPFHKLQRHHWNPNIQSPSQLSCELLEQIHTKQKLTEKAKSEKKNQKEDLEKQLAREIEIFRKREEADSLKKEHFKDVWLNEIERKNIEKKHAQKQKTVEADGLQNDLRVARDVDLLRRKSHEDALKVLKDQLNYQRNEKREREINEKLKSQQLERETLHQNKFEEHYRTKEQEKIKRNEYRDDLFRQMKETPERIKKIADGNTGFLVEQRPNRNYIQGEQFIKELSDQIVKKNKEKESNLRSEKEEHNRNLIETEKTAAEAQRRSLEQDKQRMATILKELADYRSQKQEKKDSNQKQKEMDRSHMKEDMNRYYEDKKELNSKHEMHQKGLQDTLSKQIQERSAAKLADQERMRSRELGTLIPQKTEQDLTDCDRCHKTFPKNKLTHKKTLNGRKK